MLISSRAGQTARSSFTGEMLISLFAPGWRRGLTAPYIF